MRLTTIIAPLTTLIAGTASASGQSVSPPVVISVPTDATGAHAKATDAPRYTVQVEVRGGTETLFSGALQVGSPISSRFRKEVVEAAPLDCGIGDDDNGAQRAPRSAQRSTSFSISLNPGFQTTGADRLQVAVRWSRPGPHTCSNLRSTRTVELSEIANLPPGGRATLSGDGGLVVRLERR